MFDVEFSWKSLMRESLGTTERARERGKPTNNHLYSSQWAQCVELYASYCCKFLTSVYRIKCAACSCSHTHTEYAMVGCSVVFKMKRVEKWSLVGPGVDWSMYILSIKCSAHTQMCVFFFLRKGQNVDASTATNEVFVFTLQEYSPREIFSEHYSVKHSKTWTSSKCSKQNFVAFFRQFISWMA